VAAIKGANLPIVWWAEWQVRWRGMTERDQHDEGLGLSPCGLVQVRWAPRSRFGVSYTVSRGTGWGTTGNVQPELGDPCYPREERVPHTLHLSKGLGQSILMCESSKP
jgi:hypothetical protein